jgi:hypothetical protein
MHLFKNVSAGEKAIIEKHLDKVPVPVGALARELGLEVKLILLPPDISGEIRPSPTAPAGFRINVNRHEKKERQRFTIAHEIGHYLLHRSLIGDGVSDSVLYRSTLSNQQEVEANKVAAALLMPRPTVEALVNAHGGLRSKEVSDLIAEQLEVSSPAMRIRLGLQ